MQLAAKGDLVAPAGQRQTRADTDAPRRLRSRGGADVQSTHDTAPVQQTVVASHLLARVALLALEIAGAEHPAGKVVGSLDRRADQLLAIAGVDPGNLMAAGRDLLDVDTWRQILRHCAPPASVAALEILGGVAAYTNVTTMPSRTMAAARTIIGPWTVARGGAGRASS